MSDDRGVLGLYSDGPIGMDDPRFMVRMEARRVASWAAADGLDLEATLKQVREQVTGLFGEAPQPLVDATATTAWLECAQARGGGHERTESASVDLGFRPTTYFERRPLELDLIGQVRNWALRTRLLDLLAAGKRAEVRELLGDSGLSLQDQKAFERLHPMFMGGNYLPGLEDGEVEIARVAIESTACDVTAVYARMDGGETVLRVVDEYQGDTLTASTERRAASPLSLGELVDFFFEAWPLDEVCETNYEADLPGQLDFFDAQSEFYPGFGAACALKVRACFRQRHGEAP